MFMPVPLPVSLSVYGRRALMLMISAGAVAAGTSQAYELYTQPFCERVLAEGVREFKADCTIFMAGYAAGQRSASSLLPVTGRQPSGATYGQGPAIGTRGYETPEAHEAYSRLLTDGPKVNGSEHRIDLQKLRQAYPDMDIITIKAIDDVIIITPDP